MQEVLDPLVAAIDDGPGSNKLQIRMLLRLAEGNSRHVRSRLIRTLEDDETRGLARWKTLLVTTGRVTTQYDLDWSPVLSQLVSDLDDPRRRAIATGYLEDIGRDDPEAVVEALVEAYVEASERDGKRGG